MEICYLTSVKRKFRNVDNIVILAQESKAIILERKEVQKSSKVPTKGLLQIHQCLIPLIDGFHMTSSKSVKKSGK